MDAQDLRSGAGRAGDHPAVELGARLGYAVSGVLHIVIAWIALKVAWSSPGASADQSGALGSLAGNAAGRVTLWVAVAGFAGLFVWQVAEALRSDHERGTRDWAARGKAAAKAVVYLVLAWTSLRFALGGTSSSSRQTRDFTAALMGHPGGRVVVAIIGLVVLGVGGYHVFKGATKRFLHDLVEHPGELATSAGMFGYCAKGVALAVVGLLFVAAAVHHRARQAGGLDGALHTLGQQPSGQALLTIVACGLAAYGVYSFARAKDARV